MNNEEVLQNIDFITELYVNQRDSKGLKIFHKYTPLFIYSLVQKHIFDLETIFQENINSNIDVFDFVFNMLKFTNQQMDETIYVIVQLIDFYKSMCEESQDLYFIKFHDLSNYICKYNPQLNDEQTYSQEGKFIRTLQLPKPKEYFSEEEKKRRIVRDIDINPPVIIGGLEQSIKRLNKKKIYIDCSKNQVSPIKRIYYSETLQQIIVLHQYSHHISLYYPDCKVGQIIKPKSLHLRNTIILDIYWSESQQRLGATFKDCWLCFWDACDNFYYEKAFSVTQVSDQATEQMKIKYLDGINFWITIGSDQNIHLWNLEIEQITQTINNDLQIVDIIEIPYLQLTCFAGHTELQMWDIKTPKSLFSVQTDHKRIHQVVFFKSYQIIITCGYDNFVNLYQLHQRYHDADLMGKLIGHQSLVTAIQCIENTPIIITSDDKHIIKLWDIRNIKCIQSFDLELRSPICGIVPLQGIEAVCFVTSRILVIEYENCTYNIKQLKKKQFIQDKPNQTINNIFLFPIKVEYDIAQKQLIICTKKDVRLCDIYTGRNKKILQSLISQEDDEITAFATIQHNRKFIIGTQKGQIKIFETESGELIQAFNAHSSNISNLVIDYQNSIFLTTSYDSQLITWKELRSNNKNIKQREFQYESLREIINSHNNQPIALMEVSFYHNIIITTSNNSTLLFWNHEFGKLIGTLTLDNESEPTAICFINSFASFILADNIGNIFVIQIKFQDDTFNLNLTAKIQQRYLYQFSKDEISELSPTKLSPISALESSPQSQSPKFFQLTQLQNQQIKQYTRLLVDLKKNKEDETYQLYLIASSNNGSLEIFDLSFLKLGSKDIPFLKHSNTRQNYNPYRQSREDYLNSVNTHKVSNLIFTENYIEQNQDQRKRVQSKAQQIKQNIMPNIIQNKPIAQIQAFKESCTYLNFLYLEGENLFDSENIQNKLITCSQDQCIKIWSYPSLELVSLLNINHPLPIKWNIDIQEKNILKFKIAFALKVIHFIRKNQKQKNISMAEARMLDPQNIFHKFRDQLKQHKSSKSEEYSLKFQQIECESPKQRIQVLQDAYDLNQEKQKSKKKTQNLKMLEEQKKIYNYAQQWKKEQLENEKNVDKMAQQNLIQQEDQKKELKQMIQYLHPDYRKKMLEYDYVRIKEVDPNSLYIKLEKKLANKFQPLQKYFTLIQQFNNLSEEDPNTSSNIQSMDVGIKESKAVSIQNTSQQKKRQSQFSILNNFNIQNEKKEEKEIKLLPNIHNKQLSGDMNTTSKHSGFYTSRQKSTDIDFFTYAEKKNITQKSSEFVFEKQKASTLSGSLTERQYFRELERQKEKEKKYNKIRLLSENPGALISDFQDKQKVNEIIGVNLMRKTSSNLFSKIVNSLDLKLKSSKNQRQDKQIDKLGQIISKMKHKK